MASSALARRASCRIPRASGNPAVFRSRGTTNPNDTAAHASLRRYSLAISRRVPKSFPEALTMPSHESSNSSRINCQKAHLEHDNYLRALRKHLPVICLPPLDDLPDSVFVEDTVVAIGNKAVTTNPGHPSRRPEVESVGTFLSNQLGMEVADMRQRASDAICDGGDVMWTGRHLFVGICENGRTNRAALKVLEEGLGVEAIPVPFQQHKGALHLKSVLTHLDDRTLVVPDTEAGRTVFSALADASDGAYSGRDAVWLPEHAGLSCNVVALPGKAVLAQLVHQEDAPTRTLLEVAAAERNMAIEFVSQAEAAKCDGALTCGSVLLDP